MSTGRIIVAITGASGAPYALSLLKCLSHSFVEIYLLISTQGRQVLSLECDLDIPENPPKDYSLPGFGAAKLIFSDTHSFFTPPASGSFLNDGMVIVPCSMGTMGRIAHGISNDLISRAADVTLKESRPLILVPRETPYNLIHVRNMTLLIEAGAKIVPASPGFYNKPKTVQDMIDHVVARILQQLNLSQSLVPQWKYAEEPSE